MSDPSRDAAIRGINHVNLSVRNLDASMAFYHDLLGLPILSGPFEGKVFRGREVLLLAGRISLGLQEHAANRGEDFDPTRTGLDHLAFHISSRAALDEWLTRLDDAGVAHSPIKDVPPWGRMIEVRDPDGTQLELFTLDRESEGSGAG